VHNVDSVADLTAKLLAKEVGDIGFIVHDQDACATCRVP
jgi:hypothetical protein